MERRVRGGVGRLPESRAGSADVPVGEIAGELVERLRAGERVEALERVGHRGARRLGARQDPPVENVRRRGGFDVVFDASGSQPSSCA